MELSISKTQEQFINAKANEVLFGGAAGGGKSYGQLVDAFLFAMKYPKSKQLILRRTYRELETSIIRTSLELYPEEVAKYNKTEHVYKFKNGSLIDFGYCDNETDVYKYMSSEYDVVRFDELTHFTEDMYIYLMSRIRGANDYPKQIKSSTNPGNIGHEWVRRRFIDILEPNVETTVDEEGHTRIFIPSKVDDNIFLMKKDPEYKKRLLNLNEKDKKALLYGEWDIFEGQYFSMWDKNVHVIKPFIIPKWWRRYVTMDYGRDMFACHFIAVDENGKAYVYKEIHEPNLIVTEAVKKLKEYTLEDETIDVYYAPPDLWNKHNDTGKSTFEIFADNEIYLTKANNNRIQGHYEMSEWLKVYEDEKGQKTADILFFENCKNVITCIPSAVFDDKNPNDVSKEPHNITHSIDSIRYFIAGRPIPSDLPKENEEDLLVDEQEELQGFLNYT